MRVSTRARHITAASQIIRGSLQCLFAVALLLIFAVTILVGTGAIKLPQWTKSLDQYPPDIRSGYAGGLLGCVCVLFVVFLGAGLAQMRREARNSNIRPPA